MTITANDTRDEYTATAGQVLFDYTFKIFEDTDLNVYVTPVGDAADDAADIVTGYSVTGAGSESGGTITLVTGAGVGDLVTIVSDIPETRTTDYQTNGDFLPPTVNDDFDRVVSLVKQLQDIVERGVVVQESQQGPSPLVFPAPVANKVIGWAASLAELENKTLQGTVILDDSIITSMLQDDAVTTPKIADDAVTPAKIAAPLNQDNLIINGVGTWINQEGVAGSVVLAADEYGHDMWKGGSGGCSYTFATSVGVTTLTISAGTLVQVVEGLSLASGTHVLQWTGTVQAQVDSGGYDDTGMTAVLVGGTNATIEVGIGTVSGVKLESGDTATPVIPRSVADELALCQRHYEIFGPVTAMFPWDSGVTVVRVHASFKVEKRVVPTITLGTKTGGTGTLSALTEYVGGVLFSGTGSDTDVVSYANMIADARI